MLSVCQICVVCLSKADCIRPAVSFYHPVHGKQNVLHLPVLCAVGPSSKAVHMTTPLGAK